MSALHPTDDQLTAFLGGRLAAGESATVERHLESCAECVAKLEQRSQHRELESLLRGAQAEDDRPSVGNSPLETSARERSGERENNQPTVVFAPPERSVHLKCPHCGHRIQLVEPEPNEVVCESCGSSFHVDAADRRERTIDELPRQIGKFEVLELLGRGAFGAVYKARDTDLDRIIALKVPRSGTFGSPEEATMFLREARSAAQLRHGGIVQVFEIDTQHGRPFIASEFIEGRTLADVIQSGRPGFRDAIQLVAEIADAIEYAHQQRVIHRDLKPGNILIDHAGRPHVADFGLAKREEGEITITLDGQILGTPAYMSPEQAAGDHRRVGSCSDVYSLGVILYELLTGDLPFRGNKRMLLQQVIHDEPRSLRSLNDRIPRDLETICLKTMAKSPARRYASARELADELRRWLDGRPILARPVGRIERAWRWCRRHPARAGLIVALAVAALATVGLIVAASYSDELRGLLTEVERQRDAANTARSDAELQRDRLAEMNSVQSHAASLRSSRANCKWGKSARLVNCFEHRHRMATKLVNPTSDCDNFGAGPTPNRASWICGSSEMVSSRSRTLA